MEVGRYTYGKPKIVWNDCGYKCRIGSFCSIAKNLEIYLGGNHRTDRVTTYPFGHIHRTVFPFQNPGHPASRGDVVIGNDVWIGDNVTIMSGVTIGDGAVIAANAHVVKDVPPYCIAGGNPARVLKKRFTDEQIQQLLAIAWWNWPEERINRYIYLLNSSSPDDFIRAALSLP